MNFKTGNTVRCLPGFTKHNAGEGYEPNRIFVITRIVNFGPNQLCFGVSGDGVYGHALKSFDDSLLETYNSKGWFFKINDLVECVAPGFPTSRKQRGYDWCLGKRFKVYSIVVMEEHQIMLYGGDIDNDIGFVGPVNVEFVKPICELNTCIRLIENELGLIE